MKPENPTEDCSCEPKRRTVETPAEFRERVDSGEDNRWVQSWCAECGNLYLIASEYQQEKNWNRKSVPPLFGEDRSQLRR